MLKRKWKRPLKISFSPRNSLKSKHCHPSMSQILFMILLFITHYNHTPCSSSLFLVTANDSSLPSSTTANTASSKLYSKDTPLNIHEIAELRVRDIKRRLSRQHGYSLTEISKMMDKKELIEALAFEEHKAQMLIDQNNKRRRTKYSIIVALLAVIVVMFWPLFKHVYEVVSVNVVVYTDKKIYEFSRCYSHRSLLASIGLILILFIELLQLWLSLSIILSWILPRNKYLFPTPNIPIRPAAILNSISSASSSGRTSPLEKYGINIGPMIISWFFQFTKGKVELWIGKTLAKKMKQDRKAAKKKQKQMEREQKDREEIERLERKLERTRRRQAQKRNAEIQRQQECKTDSGTAFNDDNETTYVTEHEQEDFSDFNELD